jgi:flagellar biogenesis protein FliO
VRKSSPIPLARARWTLLAIAILPAATLLAAPTEPGDRPDAASQQLNAIGQSWVDQIQGRAPGGAAASNETARNAPADNQTGGEADDASDLRLRNPGAGASDGEAQPAPTTGHAAEPESAANVNGTVAGAGVESRGEGPGLFPADDAPSFLSVVFRFFALMAVMVGLFYLAVRYLRNKTGAPVMGGSDLVQVLVSVPLVQGKFLQIVDVAGRLMVLGVSDAGVQMLESVDDGLVADRIRIWQSRRGAGPVPTSLLDKLQSVLKTSDFRFWMSGDERARKGADFASFSEWLGRQVPVENAREAQGAQGPAARSAAESEDLFASAEDKPVPDEIALKNLLKQQKRRLAATKTRPPEE